MEKNNRNTLYFIAGALKAALLLAGAYIITFGLFILMLCKLIGRA